MRASTNILLHDTRHAQLKMLADVWGCAITEAIERMINFQIGEGTILPGLPGLEVTPHLSPTGRGSIRVKIGGTAFPVIPAQRAGECIDWLRGLIDGTAPAQGFQATAGGRTWRAYRKGAGYVMGIDDEKFATLTKQMMKDFVKSFIIAATLALDPEQSIKEYKVEEGIPE